MLLLLCAVCLTSIQQCHCSWHSSVENSQVRKEVYSTKDTQLDQDIDILDLDVIAVCAARHNYRCLFWE
jgi:hypothetical protein